MRAAPYLEIRGCSDREDQSRLSLVIFDGTTDALRCAGHGSACITPARIGDRQGLALWRSVLYGCVGSGRRLWRDRRIAGTPCGRSLVLGCGIVDGRGWCIRVVVRFRVAGPPVGSGWGITLILMRVGRNGYRVLAAF